MSEQPARGRAVARTRGGVVAGLAVLALCSAPAARAQQPAPDTALARSQERLLEIRREREGLQREMDRLRGRVHSLSSELTNIERQVDISGRLVGELDNLIFAMGSRIEQTTADVIVAEDALAEKRAILEHRLAEIHKRGPLYTFQALLSAESFGDLISRYKYLHLVSRQDRQLVVDVEALRARVTDQRDALLNQRSSLARRRDERTEESERLRVLQDQRQRSLRDTQQEERRTAQRLAQIARDEDRLNNIIAELERRRRAAVAAAAARNAAPEPTRIRTTDLGQLDWPLNGSIVYNFGRQPGPGGTTIRRNGIGIAAPLGTAVRTVAAGTVRIAQALGTYGPTVIVDHGGGIYTLYGHLNSIDVRSGQVLQRGQVIGQSGGANADEGPHLYFEIRGEGGTARLDPIQWLRRLR